MSKFHYLQSVTQWISSKEAKDLVEKELQYHIQKKIKELEEKGFTKQDAERKAIDEMGNPVTVGKRFNQLYKPMFDWVTIGVFLILLLAGYLLLFLLEDSGFHLSWLNKSISIGIGMIVAVFIMFSNYRVWEKYKMPLLIGAVSFLLFFVLHNKYGVLTSWFGTTNGRPYFMKPILDSTMMIPFFLVAVAGYLAKPINRIQWVQLVSCLLLSFLMMISVHNLAMTIALFVMVIGMLLYSKRYRTVGILIILPVLGIMFIPLAPHYIDRITRYDHYGTTVAKKILSDASLLPQGIPADIVLPHTELAAVTIIYGLGYIISFLLLSALLFLLYRAVRIISEIKSEFGKLLIVGSSTLFAFQLLYNLGMITGLVPIMAVQVPFLSYGIQPILLNAIFIGILLSTFRRKHLTWKEC
ncbi:FtsW/RodA/SpoVE family cell cycle protein [Sutcliffiella horikoshii]|uniref:FtsW/RodA/SpoVE family cell cycle protein n=1 Tax=Sutcliffiella horikoshii TaxID=79883 RepID=UPI00203FC5D2|nr:FtsW/RodA/SpoVE family cell cycle protein [Sutcliffiella horikoshii]MCM3619770.1 FtsW/RodA/SpoVE family cell cycle protein [Sutcliffiella horikoshii]